jgi:hypothetical protein
MARPSSCSGRGRARSRTRGRPDDAHPYGRPRGRARALEQRSPCCSARTTKSARAWSTTFRKPRPAWRARAGCMARSAKGQVKGARIGAPSRARLIGEPSARARGPIDPGARDLRGARAARHAVARAFRSARLSTRIEARPGRRAARPGVGTRSVEARLGARSGVPEERRGRGSARSRTGRATTWARERRSEARAGAPR